jgi:hypothetical protein
MSPIMGNDLSSWIPRKRQKINHNGSGPTIKITQIQLFPSIYIPKELLQIIISYLDEKTISIW